ncbi:MAG TPA: GLUG motif-containing protein [Rhizomicrobium sp.]|jgi:hypothetical protein
MGRGIGVALCGSVLSLAVTTTAQAALVVSTAATSGVTCTGGVCKATGTDANLNAKDVTTLLSSTNVKIVAAKAQVDIEIDASVIWASSHVLTLDAYHSIAFAAPVTSEGTASGVKLITNDGGSGGDYSFSGTGSLAFWDTGSVLNINTKGYMLCKDIAALANHIASKPSGLFALSRAYDASTDGTYSAAPIPTVFSGTFEGLGNRITNLSITDTASQHMVGLFAQTNGAQLRDVVFAKANIKGGIASDAGMLVGYSVGSTIQRSIAAGLVSAGDDAVVGGLVGYNDGGTIGLSASSAAVTDTGSGNMTGTLDIGGLLGLNIDGTVQDSYATGKVTGGAIAETGGLVGYNTTDTGTATILRSYATGNVSGGDDDDVGGLVGSNISDSATGIITASYATGVITGATSVQGGLTTGGLIGYVSGGAVSLSYATGTASGQTGWFGGLSGFIDQYSSITGSFATGAVATGAQSYGGGLSGWSGGGVTDSYALGSVTGADSSIIGGLLGQNNTVGKVDQAYATGLVKVAGSSVTAGGFIGFNNDATVNTVQASYFDTQTTKQSVGIGGGTTAGPKGVTTAALQARLPAGFDNTVWLQKAATNSGFPFLAKNHPPAPPAMAPVLASRVAVADMSGHSLVTLRRQHNRLRGASPFPIVNVRAASAR